ncbi:putative DNA ligase [Erwinia phage vB_EamM_Yoloswag]|uniref:DNA ligase (NAD(+)) n=1 Tax=Erwinia phage vB_EamM_Yoloswag TaxID=1958956 RepID=A0A1S6L376_9CAUD|nr:NAD-dependent DNA ligase [Erwinia phage vB_EamM_Yoloswag]AQT28626.1 putative DNA ligase [Erwinia phage vB_EamM_Yoloswag]
MAVQLSLKRLNKYPEKVLDELTQKQVVTLVTKLDEAYHVDGEGMVSDAVYDFIRKYIDQKWPKSKLARKIGQRDDADVKLPVPMASLNQFQPDSKQLARALNKDVEWVLTDKLDGLSIELVYEGGRPVAAYTRGDATHGKDVSHHLPSMRIPQTISERGQVVIRCEALIPQKTFMSKMHESAGGRFKAARNAASGLIRNFETAKEFKYVRQVCFGIIGGRGANLKQSAQFKLLERWGFEVVRHFGPLQFADQDELIAWLERRMSKSIFELDGVVVTEDTPGHKSTASNPSHAFKFKMNVDADAVIATVEDIIYQETKYGTLQPVAVFAPTVMSGGVTVTRANGHNGYYVQHGYLKPKKNQQPPHEIRPLGPGAKVKLIRSGKVIPYIMDIIKPARKPKLPDVPYTLKGVEFVAKKKTSVATARLLGSFLKSLDVKNTGPSTAKMLVDSGITDPAALFDASMATLRAVLGDARGKQLAIDLKQMRSGLPINSWLKATAPYYMRGANTTFDKVVDSIPDLSNVLRRGDTGDLAFLISSIHGVKSRASDLAEACIAAYEIATQIGIKLKAPERVAVVSSKLKGVNVAFTGVRDRELMQQITALGGVATDSMKADTNILIAKDPGSGSAKLQKAMDKGIPIYSVAEFKRRYKLE